MNLLQEPVLHGREGDLPTHTAVLFRAAERQPTAATATEIPQSSLGRALRIRGAPFYARGFCQAAMQKSEG